MCVHQSEVVTRQISILTSVDNHCGPSLFNMLPPLFINRSFHHIFFFILSQLNVNARHDRFESLVGKGPDMNMLQRRSRTLISHVFLQPRLLNGSPSGTVLGKLHRGACEEQVVEKECSSTRTDKREERWKNNSADILHILFQARHRRETPGRAGGRQRVDAPAVGVGPYQDMLFSSFIFLSSGTFLLHVFPLVRNVLEISPSHLKQLRIFLQIKYIIRQYQAFLQTNEECVMSVSQVSEGDPKLRFLNRSFFRCSNTICVCCVCKFDTFQYVCAVIFFCSRSPF